MIKKQIKKFLGIQKIRPPDPIRFDYLGYVDSFREKRPINHNKEPIPWFTYPAIEYLAQLDFSEKTFLEFGSGNSSRYFIKEVRELISIETNPQWFEEVKTSIKASNFKYVLTTPDDFISVAEKFEKKFDVIINDHLRRDECCAFAIKHLNPGGMIIFDNSDWFQDGCKVLRNAGFIQIDFHGYGPINQYSWTTSIFFKDLNFHPKKNIQPSRSFKGIDG